MEESTRILDLDELSHRAANEAVSISMGVEVLSNLSASNLTDEQEQALSLLKGSAARLVVVIDELKSLADRLPDANSATSSSG